MEELEMEFSGAKEKANEYLESCKDEILSLQLMLQKRLAFVESKKEWRIRVWRNLSRTNSIPVLSGDKRQYEGWKEQPQQTVTQRYAANQSH